MDRNTDHEGLFDAVFAEHEENRPRNHQVELGISDLGGCREFIRATIAGDEGIPSGRVRGLDGAAIGTIVGEGLEEVFGRQEGAETQVPVTVEFPDLGIEVSGHADLVWRDEVFDFKSVNGLTETIRTGPSLKYLVQASCYAKGLGLRRASLVFYDRSGSDRKFVVYSLTEGDIEGYFLVAQSRLLEVFEVIEAGSPEESRWGLRDQEPGTCAWFACPFRLNCWGGGEWIPPETISTEDGIARVESYVKARAEAKQADSWKSAAKEGLRGIQGVTADGKWAVSWKPGRYDDRLDVIPVNIPTKKGAASE